MLQVSIHAPARGATRRLHTGVAPGFCFNPRTREGCDFTSESYNPSLNLFQSTHPRGVRHDLLRYFGQPTNVSIHAPARGATYSGRCKRASEARFNPRTREGCDESSPTSKSSASSFQSTHPRGVRHHQTSAKHNNHLVSIHAPARGATVLMICQGKSNSYLGVFENCPKRSSLKNHS